MRKIPHTEFVERSDAKVSLPLNSLMLERNWGIKKMIIKMHPTGMLR
jgi:hypothetical protein